MGIEEYFTIIIGLCFIAVHVTVLSFSKDYTVAILNSLCIGLWTFIILGVLVGWI
jgi:hypothetical protein